jgi:hypothetical protein
VQLQVAGWGGLQQLRWGGIQGCCTCVDVAGTSSKLVSLLFYMLLRCKEARELRLPTDVTSAKCAMVWRKKRKDAIDVQRFTYSCHIGRREFKYRGVV